MSTTQTREPYTGYTFPESLGLFIGEKGKRKKVEDFLYSISPTIKITSINTHAISHNTFKSIIYALTNATTLKPSMMNDFDSSGINGFLSSITSTLKISNSNSLPPSINLFFNTIVHSSEDTINLVITSSPQIKVDLTKGWKTNQSIFNFLKEMVGNSPFITLFGDAGAKVGSFFSNASTLVQTSMQMTGRDIQIGPYWSFSNSPLSNYPEFSMETVLTNDSETHYEKNREIVELLTMKYLPTTEEDLQYKFKPPYLFNIEIDINFGFRKRMYFCKATFNVTETGRYFIIDGYKKIPEFFKVSCHFTSLLPDMQNLSTPKDFYEGNSSDIEYTGPAVVYASKDDAETKNETPLDKTLDNYEKDYKDGKLSAIALPPDAVRARVGQPVQHYDPRTGFNYANPRDVSHMNNLNKKQNE